MGICKFVEGCPFFNGKMKDMPSTSEMYKKKYCLSDFENCARYMVNTKKGKQAVPENLTPNQIDKALAIINS